jgi:undecaprenyl-diphosphatase
MPPALRLPIGIVALVCGLTVIVLGFRYAGESTASQLDSWAQNAVDGLVPDPGAAALFIDFLGEPVGLTVLVVALAAVCLALGRRALAVLAVAGTLLTAAATTVLKPLVGRTIHEGFLAYPSGHTATATALGFVLMLLIVDLIRVGTMLGVLLVVAGASLAGAIMAVAQTALQAHHPTDTLGGYCTAMAIVPATAWLIDRFGARPSGADR